MFCPNCGAKIMDGAKFCEKCGSPTSNAPSAGGAPAAGPATSPRQSEQAVAQQQATQPQSTQASPAAPQAATQTPAAHDETQPDQTVVQPRPAEAAQTPPAGAPTPPTQAADQPSAAQSANGPSTHASNGTSMKLRIAALVVGVALIVLVVVRLASCNGSAANDTTPQQGATSTTSSFVGAWELVEGEAENLDAASVELLHKQGYAVTLTLREDGTGTFVIVENTTDVTWQEKGVTEASLDWGGGSTLKLSGDRLVLTDSTGSTMTFTPANAVPAAGSSTPNITTDDSSSTGSSGSESDSSNGSSNNSGTSPSAPQAGMQTIGNKACGTMQVPGGWEDASYTYDENLVSDTKMVYYVDPDSEYTSGTFSHFMFARAVQMRIYNNSYSDVAKQVIAGYESEGDAYGTIDSQETTFNGHKCLIITTSIPEDNVNLCNVAIDRDGNGHATVLLTLQGTPNTVETVLGYASTWQPPTN